MGVKGGRGGGGGGESNNEQEVKMKREAALIRRWRWATAVKTRQGERGLKLFVGSAKQMVQVPAGKRLL